MSMLGSSSTLIKGWYPLDKWFLFILGHLMAIWMSLLPICLSSEVVLESRVWYIIKARCFTDIGDFLFFRVDIARRSFPSFSTEFEGLEYNLGGMVVVSIASIIYGARNRKSLPTRLPNTLIYWFKFIEQMSSYRSIYTILYCFFLILLM